MEEAADGGDSAGRWFFAEVHKAGAVTPARPAGARGADRRDRPARPDSRTGTSHADPSAPAPEPTSLPVSLLRLGLRTARLVLMGMGFCSKSIMLGRGPAPGVELRVAIQVVRCRLGDEFREPAESELSVGVSSPPVSGVRGLPLTPDDLLR